METENKTKKFLCSPRKVVISIDRSQPNLRRFYFMRGKFEMWTFKKDPGTKAEIHTKRYFVPPSEVTYCFVRRKPNLLLVQSVRG